MVRTVKCSTCHTLVLSSLGCVYSCGDGSDGQLGLAHGSYESSKFLRPIDWFNKSSQSRIIINQIACGSDETTSHSAAIDSNHNCYVWGNSNVCGYVHKTQETSRVSRQKNKNRYTIPCLVEVLEVRLIQPWTFITFAMSRAKP